MLLKAIKTKVNSKCNNGNGDTRLCEEPAANLAYHANPTKELILTWVQCYTRLK